MKPGPPPAARPDDLDEEIIDLMSKRSLSLRQAGAETGVSYNTVKRRLAALEREGLIERGVDGRIVRTVGKAGDVTL